MTRADLNNLAGGMAIVVILLLLWWRSGAGNTRIINIHDAPTTKIDVEAPAPVNYVIPPLVIPSIGGQPWDWMQTTDLACDCGVSSWVQPMEQAPSSNLPVSYPVYKYVTNNVYEPSPPANFAVYQAPPPKTWHYETGYNVHNEAVRYPVTQEGFVALFGKYSVQGNYPQQSKDASLSGADLYYAGKHYVYDATQNKVGYVLPAGSFYGAIAQRG